MILLAKNIGNTTTAVQIAEYADYLLKSKIPFWSNKVDKVQLLTLFDNNLKTYEHHALIFVNDTHAKKLLLKSRTNLFNGKRLYMREFKLRSRNVFFGYEGEDRRRGKSLEIITSKSKMFSAVDNAHRKY